VAALRRLGAHKKLGREGADGRRAAAGGGGGTAPGHAGGCCVRVDRLAEPDAGSVHQRPVLPPTIAAKRHGGGREPTPIQIRERLRVAEGAPVDEHAPTQLRAAAVARGGQ